ncbi:MAG: SUMF1/EgtB/PvdO family nonheme iron enzyme [Anaerolineae bacterium]|nr:SUMF1/EgtB/PvdO family nonheme iron enzyme [Anaerolineae bacterium]
MKRTIFLLSLFLFWSTTPVHAQGPTPTATPVVPLPPGKEVPAWYTFIVEIWAWLVARLGFWGAVIALPLAIFLALLLVGILTKGPEDVYRLVKAAPAALWRRLRRPALNPALRKYLEQGICQKYGCLNIGALHEKEAKTRVRLPEVYIPLRGRGGWPEERQTGKETVEALLREEGPAPLLTTFLGRYPNLVLLGRAGSGKSTFLQHTAILFAQASLVGWPKEAPADLRKAFPRPPVPIYFPLRDFRPFWEKLELREKTLERQGEALLRFLGENYQPYGLDEAFFRRLLDEGRGLILLDGLDEIKAELRPTMVEVVESFVQLYASADKEHPNRCVVACRPEAIREQAFGPDFVDVTIEALDQDQVADFIPRWYREVLRRDDKLTPETEQEADEKADSLFQALEVKPQIRELTDTPLLLTMVALIHHRTGLPESRAELYWRCVELLLEKWDISRPGEPARAAMRELTPPEVPAGAKDRAYYLEPAAYWFLEAGLDRAKREEWAREIARRLGEKPEEAAPRLLVFLDWAAVERSSLIEERETGVYAFTHHRTFQEYLAARYLAGREERWQSTAMGYVPNRDWWETLRLLAAVLDPGQRRPFLEKTLTTAHPEGLLLTGTCLAEIQDKALKSALQGQVQTALHDLMLRSDQPLKDVRLLAGDLLGRLDDPRPDVNCPVPFMVSVPGGTLRMGSTPAQVERRNKAAGEDYYNDELPQHEVTLPDFAISKYPVTNAQFRRFWEAKGYARERFWTPQGWAWRRGEYEPDLSYIADEDLRRRVKEWLDQRKRRDRPFFWDVQPWNLSNRPVVGVTWFEAMAYCHWLSEETGVQYRLPTEAEWEYAARGRLSLGSPEWPWGDTFDPARANTAESGLEQTSPVGLFPGGETWCGAQDMIGNVWEWCHSLYRPYPYRADDGREDPYATGTRVQRGGSWYDSEGDARCACRPPRS